MCNELVSTSLHGVIMAKVRGIRFTSQEDAFIEEFLRKNSFLDFTTLAKIAILKFIKTPSIDLNAVDVSKIIINEKANYGNN